MSDVVAHPIVRGQVPGLILGCFTIYFDGIRGMQRLARSKVGNWADISYSVITCLALATDFMKLHCSVLESGSTRTSISFSYEVTSLYYECWEVMKMTGWCLTSLTFSHSDCGPRLLFLRHRLIGRSSSRVYVFNGNVASVY